MYFFGGRESERGWRKINWRFVGRFPILKKICGTEYSSSKQKQTFQFRTGANIFQLFNYSINRQQKNMSHNVFGGRERGYETPWTSAHGRASGEVRSDGCRDAWWWNPNGNGKGKDNLVNTHGFIMDSYWFPYFCFPRYWNVKESDVCLSFQRILLEVDFQKGFSASRVP